MVLSTHLLADHLSVGHVIAVSGSVFVEERIVVDAVAVRRTDADVALRSDAERHGEPRRNVETLLERKRKYVRRMHDHACDTICATTTTTTTIAEKKLFVLLLFSALATISVTMSL